jgi:tetratricopeptide (TPR) repeat protein
MLGKLIGKLLGRPGEENFGSKLGTKVKEKSAKFVEFLNEKSTALQKEFVTIKSKCKNLRETNYQLGLRHLENGHLSDAIFRFRFIKKFWPDLFDAYYQLAYCLVLKKKPFEARKVLQELLLKKPDYDKKARELLDDINNAEKRQ